MHYYKNNEMFPTCKKEHSLKKENYLSEFVTTNQKEFARDNLGITDIINSLDKKIDAKVIQFEGIAWDLIPTEGNVEKVLSSDAIYKALSLYITSQELESMETGLQKLVKDSSDALDLELNKAVESLLDKIQCLKQEFAKYTTQINSIIKAFRSGGAFNVSQYLQQTQSLDYIVKLTLQNAVNNAPDVAKNAGQIITFLDTENVWQQYQYQSDTIDDWDNLLKWKNLNDSSSAPIEEGAHIYNISEYLPGGAKYGQLIGAGVYTIYGDITPVSQYRTIFGWDPDLGEVNNPAEKDTSLVIKEIDTDGVAAYEYYVFVGNDSDGYGYQATFLSTEDIPEWITKAFGSTDNSILVNINKLKEEIDRTKISKGGLKTIQGKSIEGTGNIEIDTYINQFAFSNNPINWNWEGDGNLASVDIDNVKGVKASYSEEYTTGNVYSYLDVTLKAKHHYLFSFYLSGEGECDLSLSDLWNNVYVKEFSNPIIIDGDEYIENTDWKSHLTFTSVGYHYISFYANTSGTSQIDFEFNTNNNIIFYKPLFVACDAKATINWFANDEDIFTTKEQFGIAFKGVTYNSSTKKIEFICVDNTKKYLDATDFIKDGMVSSVAIVNGNLVINFNTDSGKEAISIPLTDIFNPANYYTKTDIDGKLVPATTNTLGLVKLYNTNGTNKSGLLVQEDGGLVINVPNSKNENIGIYRDDTGQLKANIKAPATDAEIEAGTSTEKAITPSNLSKVKESFGLATVATSGSYNDLDDKPVIPTSISQLSEDSVHRTVTDNEKNDYTYAAEQFIKYGIIDIKSAIYKWNYSQVNVNNDGLLIFEDYIIYNTTSVATISMYVTLTRNNETISLISRQIDKFNNTILNESFDVKRGDIVICGCSGDFELGSKNKAYIKHLVSKKSLPTKTSDLTNDSGFLTEHQSLKTINGNSIVGEGNLDVGTVTGITMNGSSKGTSGVVNLGTVLTTTTSSATSGSTTPITSGGVYTELQKYEKKMSFTSVSNLPTTCVINTYYRITSSKTSLAITLPNSSLKAGDTIGISFTAGSSITTPTVSGGTIYKQDGWSTFFEANATYEIVALYDGGKWLVTSTKFNS